MIEHIKTLELFLTEENYSSKIDRFCTDSVTLMRRSKLYRKFVELGPSGSLIGFPMPFRIMAEFIAHENLPTTEFRVADMLLERTLTLNLPTVFVPETIYLPELLTLSTEEVDQIKGMSEDLINSIETCLNSYNYNGTEHDIIEFVKEARPHIRKEVFENCILLKNFNLYLKMNRKEGW